MCEHVSVCVCVCVLVCVVGLGHVDGSVRLSGVVTAFVFTCVGKKGEAKC